MITVKQYSETCRQLAAAAGLDGHALASTEEQAAKKLQDKDGIRLVAVYPSCHLTAPPAAAAPRHEILLFIVARQIEGAPEEAEIEQYAAAQAATARLLERLLDQDGPQCPPFPNIDPASVTIDPEYNIFGGHIGWSLKFTC